jgi:serpin B
MKRPNSASSVVVGLILFLTLAGCSQPASADVLKSDKPRATSPAASQAEIASLVKGNSAFAFDLYRALSDSPENLFYSPYSISLALAMTYAGAAGGTEKQMANALHFTLAQDKLHPAFNSLDLDLKTRGQGAKDKNGEGFKLNVANAIWGQKDYKFQTSYLDLLAVNYGAGLRVVDFIHSADPSRLTINQWVSDQTSGKIKDLIPQGAVDQLTRLVLTNAIYFNAAWQTPFQKEGTANGPFHPLAGNDVTAPFMKQTSSFNYNQGANFQAVELPYDGRELSMVVLLPAAGQFKPFENLLTSQQNENILGGLKPGQVILSMPKFKFESSFSLKKALESLGMPVAFTPDADFSGMTGKKELLITDVLHKSFVAVDEAGTEAAAATGVIVGTTAMPIGPVEIKVDRPFIFFIRDIKSGTILFVGRVLTP